MPSTPSTVRRISASLAVGALLGASLWSGTARAQGVGTPILDFNLGPAVLITAEVLSLPPLIADAVYIGKGVRPPVVWPVLGFVFGTADVLFGLAFAIPNSSSGDSGAPVVVGLGAAMAVEGAVNIALGIWGLTLPRERARAAFAPDLGPRWGFTPVVLRDVVGRPTVGPALSISRF